MGNGVVAEWPKLPRPSSTLPQRDRALALTSSNIFTLACSAVPLAWIRKVDLAIDRAYRALRLSPFDPLNFLANCALAIAYFISSGMQRLQMRHAAQSN
jgi:hypothetical protein